MYLFRSPIQLINFISINYGDQLSKNLSSKETPDFLTFLMFKDIYSAADVEEGEVEFCYLDKAFPAFLKIPLIAEVNNKFHSDVITKVDGYHVVSSDFKRLVEELDPGVHNFWEVDLVFTNEKLPREKYFLFQVGRVINFFDYCPGMVSHKAIDIFSNEVLPSLSNASEIRDLPLFSVSGMDDSFFISEQLVSEAIKRGLKGFWSKGSDEERKLGHPSINDC